jgi:hypothetical protein
MGTRGEWSRRWGRIGLCACLAMAVYAAFDLPDIRGSELRAPDFGKAAAAEPAEPETEQLLVGDLDLLDGSGLSCTPAIRRSCSGAPSRPLGPSRAWTRSRVYLARTSSPERSSSDDAGQDPPPRVRQPRSSPGPVA